METPQKVTYAKSGLRKAQIADAALALIDECGHLDFTIAAVAERMGIPTPTVIYHFPTRAHLLVAAQERVDELYGSLDGDPISEAVFAEVEPAELAARIAQMGLHDPNRMRLRTYLQGEAVNSDHPAHDYVLRVSRLALRALGNLVRKRQEIGLAHPELDPEMTGRQIIAAWDGLQLQWLVDPAFDLAAAVEQTVRHLTRQDTMEAKQAIAQAMEAL